MWADRRLANRHLLPFTGKKTHSGNGALLKELSRTEQTRLIHSLCAPEDRD